MGVLRAVAPADGIVATLAPTPAFDGGWCQSLRRCRPVWSWCSDVHGELSAAEILHELTYFLSTVRAGSTWY